MPRVQVLLPLPFGPLAQLVRALACHARGRRFEPDAGRQNLDRFFLSKLFAVMAQVAEHVLGKDEVTGSNPVNSFI